MNPIRNILNFTFAEEFFYLIYFMQFLLFEYNVDINWIVFS